MRRRDFIILLAGGTTVWPLRTYAQQSQKIPPIGVLLPGTPASFALRAKTFLDGLRGLGHVEGKTIAIEWKWGEDRTGSTGYPGLPRNSCEAMSMSSSQAGRPQPKRSKRQLKQFQSS